LAGCSDAESEAAAIAAGGTTSAVLLNEERALALTTPATAKPGRYKPPDPVLAFLESL